jgi:hypothetical protein
MAEIMFNKAETIMTTILKRREAVKLGESYADWENEIEMPSTERNACYVNISGVSMPMGI